jgi:hypothetical protein
MRFMARQGKHSWLNFLLFLAATGAFAAGAHAQSLKVTLLGTGYPQPRMDRFGPSILVEAGNEKLLFDCGRGAAQRLEQLRVPLQKSARCSLPICIPITWLEFRTFG